MKSSEILRQAQQRIDACLDTYVCYALLNVADDAGTKETWRKAKSLEHRIMKSLRPHAVAESWLYDKLHDKIIDKPLMGDWCDDNQWDIRDWRVRWLGALIAEYEAKGD